MPIALTIHWAPASASCRLSGVATQSRRRHSTSGILRPNRSAKARLRTVAETLNSGSRRRTSTTIDPNIPLPPRTTIFVMPVSPPFLRGRYLSLRDFPWIPISGIVTNIVAPALFKTGSREEHEPGVVGQRHETVRITRWDKEHCRFGGGKDVPVNLDIPARCLPIINGHGSDDGRALHHSDVLGFLAVCVPCADEASPVIGNQIETLHA